MSRSGYDDCYDDSDYPLALWRGAVASSIRGKRGQILLRELLDALDAMPEKALIAGELEADGKHCALGVVGEKRGVDMAHIDPEDPDQVSRAFNIAAPLAREIVWINDEAGENYKYVDGKYRRVEETPLERWTRVRKWVLEHIK